MSNAIDALKLEALAATLPGRVQAAAQAVTAAEEQLAQVLLARAMGQTVKASDISVARMALARTQRDLEDLQRIQGVLPALLNQARSSLRTGTASKVYSFRP